MTGCNCGPSFQEYEVGGIIVCTQCGSVVNEARLVFQNNDEGQSNPDFSFMSCPNLPSNIRFAKIKRGDSSGKQVLPRTQAKRECLGILKVLSTHLCFSSEMDLEARRYAMDALNSSHYHVGSKKKAILAGVAAYLTLLHNDKPSIVTDICRLIGCDRNSFTSEYFSYLNIFASNRPRSTKSFHEMIPFVLRSINSKTLEGNVSLHQRTFEVIDIFLDVSNGSGSSPIHLIAAASFIAWKSLQRKSGIKFASFAKETGLELSGIISMNTVASKATNTTLNHRIKEIELTLVNLAKKIPCLLHMTITRKNAPLYLDDILRYRRFLVDIVKKDRRIQEEETECKRFKPDQTPDQIPDVDGDQEIDDNEIDQYIRSQEEVEKAKLIWEAEYPEMIEDQKEMIEDQKETNIS